MELMFVVCVNPQKFSWTLVSDWKAAMDETRRWAQVSARPQFETPPVLTHQQRRVMCENIRLSRQTKWKHGGGRRRGRETQKQTERERESANEQLTSQRPEHDSDCCSALLPAMCVYMCVSACVWYLSPRREKRHYGDRTPQRCMLGTCGLAELCVAPENKQTCRTHLSPVFSAGFKGKDLLETSCLLENKDA